MSNPSIFSLPIANSQINSNSLARQEDIVNNFVNCQMIYLSSYVANIFIPGLPSNGGNQYTPCIYKC
jgi:hypothetical protein